VTNGHTDRWTDRWTDVQAKNIIGYNKVHWDDALETSLALENGRTTTPTIRSATASDTMNLLVVILRSLLCVNTAMMTMTLPTMMTRLRMKSAVIGPRKRAVFSFTDDDVPDIAPPPHAVYVITTHTSCMAMRGPACIHCRLQLLL